MVRGKIEVKRIENATSRQVTFSKRKSGLLKKARELSVLCDSEVAVIIFSQTGRLNEFSSNEMQKTIDRYRKHVQRMQTQSTNYEQPIQLLGQDLHTSSYEELQDIDNQLQRSLLKIRATKALLFEQQIEQLKAKEKYLLEEDASLRLREKCPISNIANQQNGGTNIVTSLSLSTTSRTSTTTTKSTNSDVVETNLSIGLVPNITTTSCPPPPPTTTYFAYGL